MDWRGSAREASAAWRTPSSTAPVAKRTTSGNRGETPTSAASATPLSSADVFSIDSSTTAVPSGIDAITRAVPRPFDASMAGAVSSTDAPSAADGNTRNHQSVSGHAATDAFGLRARTCRGASSSAYSAASVHDKVPRASRSSSARPTSRCSATRPFTVGTPHCAGASRNGPPPYE